jgi:hypothetical protein
MNRFVAQGLSIIFHPLMMMTYICIIILFLNPYIFSVHDISKGGAKIVQVFFATFCLPALIVAMMKGLNIISSLEMPDPKERIIPYISTATLYLWVFMMMKNTSIMPIALVSAMLGCIIGIFISFFFNNFFKISAHAVGVGGLVAAVLLIVRWYAYSFFYVDFMGTRLEIHSYWMVIFCVLVSGLVCTARLSLGAHNLKEIASGFVGGFLAQWIAHSVLT